MMNPTDNRTGVTIRPLDRDLYDSFERLLARFWEQSWPDDLARDIIRWRYYERPEGHVTWVGCAGNECVASLDSRVRPYLLLGQRTMVRETADWYCMPEYRHLALGLRLLRKIREYPEPALVVGGSDMTRQILPRLGWTVLNPPVYSYILPVTARGLIANVVRQKWPRQEPWARFVWGRLPARAPRRVVPPGRPDIQILGAHDWHEVPADADSHLVALLEQDHWEWMSAMPRQFAEPLGMVFRLDGAVVGSCLAQLEPSATGMDGRIVHLQVCRSDTRLTAWIVSAATRLLVERGAEFIRCFVSTPEKVAAVEAAGFMFSQTMPCFWWNVPGAAVPGSVDLDYLRGDDGQPLAAMRGRFLHRKTPPLNGSGPLTAVAAQVPETHSA